MEYETHNRVKELKNQLVKSPNLHKLFVEINDFLTFCKSLIDFKKEM